MQRIEAQHAVRRAGEVGDTAEREVIERAKAGERTSQRELVRRHQRRVFAFLSRALRGRASREMVEDLAQETFLRVFRSLDGFDCDGAAKFSTWLLRIASNLAIDELRRKQLPTNSFDDGQRHCAAPERADTQAERRALARILDQAVSDLSPPLRVAFVLRTYHDFDYGEISQTLDVDIGTVKSRLSRARAKLRRALEGLDHGH